MRTLAAFLMVERPITAASWSQSEISPTPPDAAAKEAIRGMSMQLMCVWDGGELSKEDLPNMTVAPGNLDVVASPGKVPSHVHIHRAVESDAQALLTDITNYKARQQNPPRLAIPIVSQEALDDSLAVCGRTNSQCLGQSQKCNVVACYDDPAGMCMTMNEVEVVLNTMSQMPVRNSLVGSDAVFGAMILAFHTPLAKKSFQPLR